MFFIIDRKAESQIRILSRKNNRWRIEDRGQSGKELHEFFIIKTFSKMYYTKFITVNVSKRTVSKFI